MALMHQYDTGGLPGGGIAPAETGSDVPSHGDSDAPLISLLSAYRQVALAAGMEPQDVETQAAEVFPDRTALRGYTGSTVLSMALEAIPDANLPALLVKISTLPGANREATTAQQANLEQLPLCAHMAHVDVVDAYARGFAKGWFPKGWFWRMFPRNENRNEGTVAKTTLLETALLSPSDALFGVDKRVVSKRVVSADVPQERKPERGYVRQNHPFTKPPFYLPVIRVRHTAVHVGRARTSSLRASWPRVLRDPLARRSQLRGSRR